ADRNRSHWSTSKTPSYTKSVSWQHHRAPQRLYLLLWRHYNLLFYYLQKVKYKLHLLKIRMGIKRITAIYLISEDPPR
ncbi:hypothetical protein P2S10_06855, partial [Escherichia coli]